MNLSLNPDVQELINERVNSGRYGHTHSAYLHP